MIGDIISHIMVKQHSLGWQMTVAGNFKETDFFLRHSKLFIRPFWGTFKTKQLPNCDFQHRQKSVDFWVYTLLTLVDLTKTMTLTYICSVDTRNRPVWGGGGRAIWHRSVLSRKRFICRPDGADWRLTTQKKRLLSNVEAFSEHQADDGHALKNIHVCKFGCRTELLLTDHSLKQIWDYLLVLCYIQS